VKLIQDPDKVKSLLGFVPKERLLCPNLAHDARHVSTPPVVETDDGRYLLFIEEIERGSVLGAKLPPNVTPAYYAPYFSWDRPNPEVPAKIEEAIMAVTRGRPTEGDAFVTVDLALKTGVYLPDGADNPWGGRNWGLRRIKRDDVLERFERSVNIVTKLAEAALESDPEAQSFLELFGSGKPEDRYRSLEQRMNRQNVDLLLLTSRLNIQDVAGIPALSRGFPPIVVYAAGQQEMFVLERTETGEGKTLSELTSFLWDSATGIAVEDQDMTIGQLKALGLANRAPSLRLMSREIRTWRDELSGLDLPYYVLAAKITTMAIKSVLDKLDDAVSKGGKWTEKEVAEHLEKEYRHFFRRLAGGFDGFVITSHLNIHAGTRTTVPSLPTDYAIGAGETSLKIDSGVFFAEKDGTIRAATDMGRTLVYGEKGRDLYACLHDTVTKEAIPHCRHHTASHEIYLAATRGLDALKDRLYATGLTPQVDTYTVAYNRYVGHVVGKQRYVNTVFTRQSDYVLKTGVCGAIEIPWAFGRYGLQYEDMFVVHPDRGLNLTKYHPPMDV